MAEDVSFSYFILVNSPKSNTLRY